MDEKALRIVRQYITEHLDESDCETFGPPVNVALVHFEVYVVWKCKTLQNWKWLISSSLCDGMYYELTYDGNNQRFYLDAYKKFENQVIVWEDD